MLPIELWRHLGIKEVCLVFPLFFVIIFSKELLNVSTSGHPNQAEINCTGSEMMFLPLSAVSQRCNNSIQYCACVTSEAEQEPSFQCNLAKIDSKRNSVTNLKSIILFQKLFWYFTVLLIEIVFFENYRLKAKNLQDFSHSRPKQFLKQNTILSLGIVL